MNLRDRHGLRRSVFDHWEREFFEKGHRAFQQSKHSGASKLEKEFSRLEQKLTYKNDVLSELMEELSS